MQRYTISPQTKHFSPHFPSKKSPFPGKKHVAGKNAGKNAPSPCTSCMDIREESMKNPQRVSEGPVKS